MFKKEIDKIKSFFSITSIKKKLVSSYLFVTLPISFLLIVVIMYSLFLNAQYTQVISNFSNYNNIYNLLDSEAQELFLNISEQKSFDKQKKAQIIKKINENIESIKYDINNQEINSEIEIIKRTIKSFQVYIDKINTLIEKKAAYEEKNRKFDEVVEATSLVKGNLQRLMVLELSSSQQKIENIRKNFYMVITVIVIAFFMIILACMLFISEFTEKIVGKIIKISENANKLAEGNLNIEEVSFKTNDEFLILASSFNKMKNNIRKYINNISNSEKRLGSILDGMTDCVLTIDKDNLILSGNHAVKNVFGYEVSEILGKHIKLLIPDIEDKLSHNNTDSQEGDGSLNIKQEFNGLRTDESTFPVEIGLSQIENSQSEEKIFIVVIHDITQRKEMEQMKNEFISMVSHELRTPLTSIKGSLDLMLNQQVTQLPDSAYKLAEISRNNSARLISLINDILDIEKIAAGKMDFYYETVELSSLIVQTVVTNMPLANQYKISFEVNENLPQVNVNVDKNRLIQVITNLLSNAAKYAPEGSKVEIDSFPHEGFIRTSVKNYGPPISEDFKSKIFQKFTQSNSALTRKKGGTGLGLNICKSIMENMNGRIGFDSNEEATVFYFDLPEEV